MTGWRKRQVIEHMWKVASNNPNHDTNWHDPVVERFAELVRADEREGCAKVCEDSNTWDLYDPNKFAANLIRAKGQA
jgi:hypothetical protein